MKIYSIIGSFKNLKEHVIVKVNFLKLVKKELLQGDFSRIPNCNGILIFSFIVYMWNQADTISNNALSSSFVLLQLNIIPTLSFYLASLFARKVSTIQLRDLFQICS